MDRTRFDYLLEAYGADLARWPQGERAAAAAFADTAAGELAPKLAQARALDAALDAAWGDEPDITLLRARIMKQARPGVGGVGRRVAWTLAACAIFGVLAGFGGAQFAPAENGDESYFALAFEAPPGEEG